MDTAIIIELVGYLGSALVVVSMLMSSVVKLRVINTVGSIIFAIYALIIHSYPTAIMNFFLVAINIYNLIKLLKTDKHFSFTEGGIDDLATEHFVSYFNNDIVTYFPDFVWDKSGYDVAITVYSNENPAGLLLGKKNEEGGIDIAIEYSTPYFRDCSVGKYLHNVLEKSEYKNLYFKGNSEKHEWYLIKMGFEKIGDIFKKEL